MGFHMGLEFVNDGDMAKAGRKPSYGGDRSLWGTSGWEYSDLHSELCLLADRSEEGGYSVGEDRFATSKKFVKTSSLGFIIDIAGRMSKCDDWKTAAELQALDDGSFDEWYSRFILDTGDAGDANLDDEDGVRDVAAPIEEQERRFLKAARRRAAMRACFDVGGDGAGVAAELLDMCLYRDGIAALYALSDALASAWHEGVEELEIYPCEERLTRS